MDKKDFDVDFDFEKELGFDPKEFLDSDQEDVDLSEFKDIELTDDDLDLSKYGIDENFTPEEGSDDSFDDFDLDSMDAPAGGRIPYSDADPYEDAEEEPREDLPEDDFRDEELYDEDASYEEPQEEELLRRPRREQPEEAPEEPREEEPSEEEAPYEEKAPYEEEEYDEEAEDDGEVGKRKKRPRPQIHIPKPTMPPFFKKFLGIYFGPMIAELSGTAPETEGRRRRSKRRTFKEVYLPPLILFVALVMVITCIVGSISTAVRGKLVRDEEARKESIAQEEAANRQEQQNKDLMERANAFAQEYDYDKAIEVLESYEGEVPQEILAKKAEYANLKAKLVEVKDPAGIPNLSFQLLIADPARAYADQELGGKYNQNFVTTDEFQRILESLYANNYVLVDFDSFSELSVDLEGKESFITKPILLPADKKPVMITETMVNYYPYMIDGNKDGVPDKDGAGFASRLLVDANGDIKAEMVDKDGNVVVGNYDLVPILEDFLKLHPDFAYRGARATLAVTGEHGIFGYRINSSVISDPKRGEAYYNDQVAGAKELVTALREKGYTMASFTFGNRNYGQDNANQISEDLQSWDTQITPVIGPVNIMVYARESDIGDYTGTKYKALYEKGFRIFVGKSDDQPFTDVTTSYIRQKRLMVTGVNMTFNPKMFTNMFDPAAVMNPTRPEVIKN